MYIAISILMVFSGFMADAYSVTFNPTFDQWQVIYSVIRDLQFVGYALLAFELCPYKRVEFKVMAFFLALYRTFVCVANLIHVQVEWGLGFVVASTLIYVLWLWKTARMKELEEQAPIDGAYYFMMPVHSVWGLLKAVFMPWQHSRYESIVIAQGRKVWAVHKGYFVVRNIEDTDIFGKRGVRRYIGRDLEQEEIDQLDKLVGKRAFPGLRDCRRLRVV